MVSLVLSKLDYCNVLLTGLPDFYISKLQRVQNCAAKVIFKKRKFDNVTPLLHDLHWLPVRERINFKVATFCYKFFENSTPLYISSLLDKQTFGRQLRSSSDKTILKIPKKKLKSYGERSFTFFAPTLWNSLPRDLRESSNLIKFKKALKNHLFLKAYY